MPSELAVAIAAAITGRSGEGGTALAALARTVRDRLGRDHREADASEAELLHEAGDHGRQSVHAEQLSRALAEDPRFAGLVRDQWHAAQTELTMGEAAVHNSFSGTADKVVQARDIHGDLTF